MAWNIEVTDTFAGEANYSWVKRFSIPSHKGESELATMRRAKKAAGLNGIRCNVSDYGDSWRLDVQGACICAFIHWTETEFAFDPELTGESV